MGDAAVLEESNRMFETIHMSPGAYEGVSNEVAMLEST